VTAPSWTAIDWTTYVREATVHERRIHYVDYGEGPALLLIHGMAGSWQTWLANISELGQHYRVIAVDLPGFGGSESLPAGSEFDAYGQMLEGLLDELGLQSVAVIGHSLGGLVALTFAASVPWRVRCAVLVSGGGGDLSRTRLAVIQSVFRLIRVILAVPGLRDLFRHPRVGRALIRPAVHDPDAVPQALLSEMIPHGVSAGFLDGVRLGGHGLRALDPKRIVSPVLLVWGREDRILPLRTAHRLKSQLGQADLVVFDGVGHCAMFEKPNEFNRTVEDFLATQWSDRGASPADRATARSWIASAGETHDGIRRCGDGIVG
jgi:pimeloyl-ACP methyl ester carboxylesterase